MEKIRHLIRTRSRPQKQRSDRGQNARAAGPSLRANLLRCGARRCGRFVRSIRVAKLFVVDARMKASRPESVARLKAPGDYLLSGRVSKRPAVSLLTCQFCLRNAGLHRRSALHRS